jgi:hypothetical protein
VDPVEPVVQHRHHHHQPVAADPLDHLLPGPPHHELDPPPSDVEAVEVVEDVEAVEASNKEELVTLPPRANLCDTPKCEAIVDSSDTLADAVWDVVNDEEEEVE